MRAAGPVLSLACSALIVLSSVPAAHAEDALWALLRAGGHVVMIRHSTTDPGAGDPPGFRLEDCATQRNLNEAGREQARRIGAAFRARGIPIAGVLSSRWCRCLETARLAFGRVEPWWPLDSQFHDKSQADEQARAVRQRAGESPAGGNLIMISHGTNIAAWTGVHPAQGEMVVLAPLGDGSFRVAGRLAPSPLGAN
jgi:phosphohistidine phosphatase SixA